MENLATSFTNPVEKDCGNERISIVDIFIKPRASKMFGYTEYSLYVAWLSIAAPITHKEFFKSAFGIWLGRNVFQMDVADQLVWIKYGGK